MPSVLLLSEVWYPAWRAYVDGEEREVLRADYSLRGVPLEAGDHKVEFVYDSDRFSTGLWISVTSLIILLGAIALLVVRRVKSGYAAGERDGEVEDDGDH
jgi:uncharacterized membrane protein YfhO